MGTTEAVATLNGGTAHDSRSRLGGGGGGFVLDLKRGLVESASAAVGRGTSAQAKFRVQVLIECHHLTIYSDYSTGCVSYLHTYRGSGTNS